MIFKNYVQFKLHTYIVFYRYVRISHDNVYQFEDNNKKELNISPFFDALKDNIRKVHCLSGLHY